MVDVSMMFEETRHRGIKDFVALVTDFGTEPISLYTPYSTCTARQRKLKAREFALSRRNQDASFSKYRGK